MASTRLRTPVHLGPAGTKLYRELTAEYGIADAAGLRLVETAAHCMDRLRAAQAIIADQGTMTTDRYGLPKVHPACNLERDARNGLLAALKALNLDLEPLRDGPGRPANGGVR